MRGEDVARGGVDGGFDRVEGLIEAGKIAVVVA